ncbi:MAG: Obg family GTPase CgtA, partial [Clostridia bacterium]|nr:Obg family GTPase CgtA [Clostridia bacterium]
DADSVTIWRADDASFHLEGAWLDALMGRVNFGDRESLMYFERSLVKFGIIQKLRDAGCEEGDMVHIGDFEFEFVD